MAMGRQGDRQGDLMVMWSEMPRSPGHVFYDRLQEVLVGAGFDGFVEEACRAYYAKTMGAPSVPPGRYFRMHMVGYFEGIDSERGIAWRCSDSFSLREFLRLEPTTGFRAIPGCRRRGAGCPMRCTNGVRLGSGLDRRTRAGAGRTDRRGCFDPGGQCRPAGDRAPGYRLKTNGQAPQEVSGKYVVVWQRVGGEWKLATDIWNAIK